MKTITNIEVHKTCWGHTIEVRLKDYTWPLYVRSVYKGKARLMLGYDNGKGYTEKTANRIASQILSGEIEI